MERSENLLITAMEECSEIQKDISKSLRFGLNNFGLDNQTENNAAHCIREFYELCATIEMLQTERILPKIDPVSVEQIKSQKKQKIEDYMLVSKSLGRLSTDQSEV